MIIHLPLAAEQMEAAASQSTHQVGEPGMAIRTCCNVRETAQSSASLENS